MKPSLPVIRNVDVYIVAIDDQITAHVQHHQRLPSTVFSIPTRSVWLVLYILLSASISYATSIVAIRTDKTIVIAADSKGTTKALILGVNSEPISYSVCKIKQSGNVFFATSGINRGRDAKTGQIWFSLDDEIATIIEAGGTVRQITDRLTSSMTPRLQSVLTRAHGGLPLNQGDLEREGVTVILATIESGVPILIRCDFLPTVSVFGGIQITPVRDDCPGNCDDGYIMHPVGEVDALKGFLEQHGPDVVKRSRVDPVAVARELVQMEIDARGDIVGPPIAILRITKDGTTWIDRGACPDIQSATPKPTPKPAGRNRRRG